MVQISKTRKLVLIAILVAQGIVLSFIERSLPLPFIAPGAKLGLANIVSLTGICVLPFSSAFAVVVLRVLLVSLTFGSLSSMLYALAGGIFSFFVMAILVYTMKDYVSLIGVSIAGAASHNIAQLIVASMVLGNVYVGAYLPILLLVSIPTGLFVGLVATSLVRYLKRSFTNK